MKKILVTGPFEGSAVLLYGDGGMGAEAHPPLVMVDFREAFLTDVRKKVILQRVPLRYGGDFLTSWDGVPVKFTDVEVELDFEQDFWKPYNKKVNKILCEPLWAKLTLAERSLLCAAVGPYNRYLIRKGIEKLDPVNFMKRKCWKNDYDNIH